MNPDLDSAKKNMSRYLGIYFEFLFLLSCTGKFDGLWIVVQVIPVFSWSKVFLITVPVPTTPNIMKIKGVGTETLKSYKVVAGSGINHSGFTTLLMWT